MAHGVSKHLFRLAFCTASHAEAAATITVEEVGVGRKKDSSCGERWKKVK